MIEKNKYYVCVKEYREPEVETESNQFLATIREERLRSLGISYIIKKPSFRVGIIYRSLYDGVLMDDRCNRVDIKDSDLCKFVKVDIPSNVEVSYYIKRMYDKGVHISFRPAAIKNFSSARYAETGDLLEFDINFQFCLTNKWSYTSEFGTLSLDTLVRLWKKARLKSFQVMKLRKVLPSRRTPNWNDTYIPGRAVISNFSLI